MRSIKEALSSLSSLKRCHPWPAGYFASRKAKWYPPTENDINCRDISTILLSKAVPSSITVADEEALQIWANTYTRAFRQRTVHQETTMAKTGTLPHVYTAKISEVPETNEEYSIQLMVLTDVSTAVVSEKEVVIKEVQKDDKEKSDEFEPSSDEEEELYNAHPNIATSSKDVAALMKDCYSWLVV